MASPPNLADEEKAALIAELKQIIAADRFPLSPRIRKLQAILNKLEPSAPRPQPHPAPKPARRARHGPAAVAKPAPALMPPLTLGQAVNAKVRNCFFTTFVVFESRPAPFASKAGLCAPTHPVASRGGVCSFSA